MRKHVLATAASISLAGGALLAFAPAASATRCDKVDVAITADPISPARVPSETDKAAVTFTATASPDSKTVTDTPEGFFLIVVHNIGTGAIVGSTTTDPNAAASSDSLSLNLAVGEYTADAEFITAQEEKGGHFCGEASADTVKYRVIVVQSVPGPTVTDTATATVTATETKTVTVSGGSSGPGFTG